MLIAIDTSTDTAGLALMRDGRLLAELDWRCGQNHSTQLLPGLNRLLEQAGLSLEDAAGIVVARGPGSYNGLRVGVTTAKSLAYSLEIPVIGVSTLEAEAWQHAAAGLPVCPLFNAGREEIATASYLWRDGVWQRTVEERLTTIEALCSETTEQTLFCGEHALKLAEQLREKLGDMAVLPEAAALFRRAGFLAELGWRRFQAGDFDDAATLQPAYFRGPSITRPRSDKK